MNKWLSRKFLAAVTGVLVVILTQLGLPAEVASKIGEFIVWILGIYIGVEGVVDVARAKMAR